ncbi:MAG TPA: hypothetical protein PLL19_07190 [Thiobacillaceae bacterium]|nr:hypothetical protein [Thiobacillaceae bacterium]HNF89098.1 hypothetical protein [Thiobacillaceae bacterium]HNI07335.1 hypothetical protein [Thiobacillaceae bacterium]
MGASVSAPRSPWLPRLLAPLVLAGAALGLSRYPFAPAELGMGLAVYAALGFWRPHLMLFLLPPWLALVNLAPWSGSLYLEDYDLLLAVTLGVFLGRGLYATRIRLTLGEWIFLGLLTLSYGISLARGLLPLPAWNPVELSTYYSQWNALRLSKGFFWALALFPGLVALFRTDQKRVRASLVWGLAVAGGAVGVVAMWERGVLNALAESGSPYVILSSLLDFTTPYRITGLFSEMHTGGEAIDGFVALVWPFSLLAAANHRSKPLLLVGGALLAGILYAGVTTFSRATYLAFLAGSLLGGLLWFLSRRKREGTSRGAIHWPAIQALPGVLAALVLALAFTRGGVQALGVGLAGWAGCLMAGHFASRGRPWAWRALALALVAVSGWGVAESMLTSKWVDNTALAAALMGGGLALVSGLGGFSAGWRLSPFIGGRGVAIVMLVVASAVGIITPALLGSRMDTRMSTTSSDMDIRYAHWLDAIDIMNRDWATTLFGMGVGRFPATFLWAHSTGNMGSYRFLPDGKGYYLALGGGQDLRFTQRVSLPAYQPYTLSMDVRTADPKAWLHVMLYRRNIILPNEWPGQHIKFESHVENTGGQWQHMVWNFNVGPLGDGAEFGRQPLVLELMNWRKYDYVTLPGTVLDIDNVSLKDARGRELLANGDFSRGLERWFPHYDFNHLPWHVKNLWVNAYFDQGLLGVLALGGFLATTIFAAIRRGLQGDPWGLAVSASMASFLAVGLFGGLLDMPRIIFICYLMLFVTALSGPIRRRRLGPRVSRALAPEATQDQ